VRLYIGFRVKETAEPGNHPVRLVVADSEGRSYDLDATVDVLPATLPQESALRHWMCMYTNLNPAGAYPEAAARDLASHGVTDAQFPYAPEATFASDGTLLNYDFKSTK